MLVLIAKSQCTEISDGMLERVKCAKSKVHLYGGLKFFHTFSASSLFALRQESESAKRVCRQKQSSSCSSYSASRTGGPGFLRVKTKISNKQNDFPISVTK